MAKRKRTITENKIEKLIKEGRGQGIGTDYKPWIFIQDVPSLGRATRLKGIKTTRQHEFLSDMERDYFYILEYSDNVIDIREQFPLLPLEETLLIAKELGIKHPTDPNTKEPIVMTTDFLITINKDGRYVDIARTIKSQEDLINKRTVDKFEIERRYWEKQGIDWGIVTEQEINKVVAQNISYIHSYYDIDNIDSLVDIEKNCIDDLTIEYIKRVIDGKSSIREISKCFDKDLGLKVGTGICLFRHILIKKIIQVDLYAPIDINNLIDVKLIKNKFEWEWSIS